MKFARLYLKAYGAFRDRVIELPIDEGRNLHLIFGSNEAGKSTLLRAVTGFLFGISERTTDAFLHDYTALRVGATLVLPDGGRLSCMRRKARKATLFALDEATGSEMTEQTLSERVLADCLGGLDQALYQHLFGLDLAGLVAGSEELLRGEGELGRTLFQAAAGLGGLRAIWSALDEEAAALFKPRGSAGRLNQALRAFEDERGALKRVTVRSSAWESAERVHREAENQYGRLRDDLKGYRTEQQSLSRIRANLPLIAERAVKRAEWASLDMVPLLEPRASARRHTAQERLRVAEQALIVSRARLLHSQAALAAIRLRHAVLAHEAEIEEVFHELKDVRVARGVLPQLLGDRRLQDDEVRRSLAAIAPDWPPEEAASILPTDVLVARIQSLIEESLRFAGVDDPLQTQGRVKEAAREGLARRLAMLPDLPPLEESEEALVQSASLPELEDRQQGLDRDIAAAAEALQGEAAALWPGPLPELMALSVPLPETATQCEANFLALTHERVRIEQREREQRVNLEQEERELKVLAATGEVVTQTEVTAARRVRDNRWASLRRDYLEGAPAPAMCGPGPSADRAAAEALDSAIKEADRLADLLHAATERATKCETARLRIVDIQMAMSRLAEDRTRWATAQADLDRRWGALIAPLRRPELTPSTLRDWLAGHRRLHDRSQALAALRAAREANARELSQTQSHLDRLVGMWGLAPLGAGESAAGVWSRAQRAVQAAQKARGERRSLAEQIDTLDADLRSISAQRQGIAEKVSDWQTQWAQALAPLHLKPDALPAEARVRLGQFGQLSTALRERARLSGELERRKEALAAFERHVADLGCRVEEPSEGRGPDELAARLHTALHEAREAKAEYDRLSETALRETQIVAQHETAIREARAEIAVLLRAAACAVEEDLPLVEEQAARKRVLKARLVEIDELLVTQNASDLDVVLREAGDWDLNSLEKHALSLATRIEDAESRLEAAQSRRFQANQEFEAMDGGAAAADAQQALLSSSARIGRDARGYAHLRLAGAILARIEQTYRDRHQGPLLQRAAALFTRMTLGSFAGLTVDYENDRQALLGLRASGAQVAISGMSQGTRDQLFLALRLAAIEQHIEGRGSVPLIIDDLLVQFDDERALATLSALEELSRKTQVLFFTHHRHMVDLVQASEFASALVVHHL